MKIVKILELIGRTKELFQEDIQTYEKELSKIDDLEKRIKSELSELSGVGGEDDDVA